MQQSRSLSRLYLGRFSDVHIGGPSSNQATSLKRMGRPVRSRSGGIPSSPAIWRELRRIFGDGVNQAADLVSGATSIPSRNLTPLMTFGN